MTDSRRDHPSAAGCWRLTPLAAAVLATLSPVVLARTTPPAGYGVESNAGLPVYAASEGREDYTPAPARPPAPAPVAASEPIPVPAPAATTSAPSATIATSTASPDRGDREPALDPARSKGLPSMDSAGERLGWMSAADIARLPAGSRPDVDATCGGAWVTPIAASVQTGKLDESDIAALADSLSYRDNGEAVLEGQVRIEQAGRRVEADSGYLTQNREYGRFDGNIRVAEPGLLLTGEQAVVNISTNAGQLLSSEFVASTMNAHGRAERIRRYANGVTVIDRGIYTTCAPGQRSWAFDARDIALDPNTGMGEVRHAKLLLSDVPVLYVPYYRFPIDDRRHTGLLVPRFGNTNDGGFDLSVPVYLNLAPAYDATLTPRLINRRGAMLEGEFRYLTQNFGSGEISGSVLPDDRLADRDRKSGSYNHRVNWGEGWSARTSLNYVSDFAYYTDLGTDLTIANRTHQERIGEVRYDTAQWHLLGRVQGFQTIDPGLLDADRPYARLPQLLLTSERTRLPGWQRSLRAEVANFQRNIDDGSAPEINGLRMRLDPELRYDYSQLWGYVRPGVKLSHLQYALEGSGVTDDNDPSLTIPTVSLDSGLYFERFSENGASQTLEPRLYYLYSPYKDQLDNPNFDTANTTFSYDQLFRDSRFSGSDRIDDANQVSFGVTSRWMNSEGFEHLQASLGQIVYFRDRLVRLPITGVITPPVARQPTSSYAGNLTLRVNEEVSFFADALMDPEGGRLSQYSAAASIQPSHGGSLYNAGYRYRREDLTIGQKPVSQTHLSFVQPFGVNWKVLGLWNYDVKERESQEALFGVSYESCCWQVRVFKRKFLADAASISNSADREREAVFVEVALKGLAGLGSGVDALFEKNVFGYTQLQQKEENF